MDSSSTTDWIQAWAAVTAATTGIVGLYFVIVTLRAQLKLNTAQFKLFEFEASRAAQEIRPRFKLEYTSVLMEYKSQDHVHGLPVYRYKLSCIGNTAKKVCIEFLQLGFTQYSENMHPGNSIGLMVDGDSIELKYLEYKNPNPDTLDKNLTIFRVHYYNINNKPEYQDFQMLNITTHKEHDDDRHSIHPGVNKLNACLAVPSSIVKPIGYGFNDEITKAYDNPDSSYLKYKKVYDHIQKRTRGHV